MIEPASGNSLFFTENLFKNQWNINYLILQKVFEDKTLIHACLTIIQ
jgi:hypothetical protein